MSRSFACLSSIIIKKERKDVVVVGPLDNRDKPFGTKHPQIHPQFSVIAEKNPPRSKNGNSYLFSSDYTKNTGA